jgi:hypothetical protein
MTSQILPVTGDEAWDLIFPEFLGTMGVIEQETMRRTLNNSSHIWAGVDDDKILATWGVIPPTLLSDRAYLWMFHTPHLQEHIFVFVRHSQRVVQEALEFYPILVGHAVIGNTRAIRWLKWLGAEFGKPINDKVLPFEIRAGKWQRQRVQSA